jgi:hypothetical protein
MGFTLIKPFRNIKLVIPDRPINRLCAVCGVSRQFKLIERNASRYFLYLYMFDRQQSYAVVCVECDQHTTLSLAQTRELLPNYIAPAPIYRQRLILALIIVPLFAWMIYSNVLLWLK